MAAQPQPESTGGGGGEEGRGGGGEGGALWCFYLSRQPPTEAQQYCHGAAGSKSASSDSKHEIS